MPEYRRAFAPGGTFFLTIVTYQRRPLFAEPENVTRLHEALAAVQRERPFEILASAMLPDHLHFVWLLPPDDTDFSTRIGKTKVLFTRSLSMAVGRGGQCPPYAAVGRSGQWPPHAGGQLPASRVKHRESDVWQRRFWEHTIRDERDLEQHVDYIHYNPVKHGLVSCPHRWPNSSFRQWVGRGVYDDRWCCVCAGRRHPVPDFTDIDETAGE